MTTYLDKEAVLKAFQERFKYPSYAFAEFIEQIEHGKFDALQIPMGIDHLGLAKALADKDAEIARLKKESFFVSTSATIRGKSILASFRIIGDLKARIAELEKLTALQKETIDAQGKALQEARFTEDCRIYGLIKCLVAHEGYDCGEVDHILEYLNGLGQQPAQKEPASQPSPVPTSGTGTAPEGATVDRARSGMLDDEHCVCDACILDSGIPSECGHDPEECKTIALGHAYPGMAKDIGDLTLRVDNLESETRHHNARLHEIEQRQGRDRAEIIKEVKDQREDYHAHIRQLVEENGLSHKELSKDIEALRDAMAERK